MTQNIQYKVQPILSYYIIYQSALQLTKRSSTGDIADSDYSKYGGTTGGSGGSIINVATLVELTSATASDSPKIIIITAPITGSAVIQVGSNTSIIGKSSTTGNMYYFMVISCFIVIS